VSFTRFGIALVFVGACSTGHYATVEPGHPAYVVPHHIAEGKGEGEDLPAAAAPEPSHAASVEPAAPPLSSGTAPDPEPLLTREQWQYSLLYQGGTIRVEHVQRHDAPKPVTTARRMGRFALELWIGHELIDRTRFDFPLIAAEEAPGRTRRPLHDAPNLGTNAIARVSVLVPNSSRATRLMLVDRATGKTEELAWPPDREPSPIPSAGASSAAPVAEPVPTLVPNVPKP